MKCMVYRSDRKAETYLYLADTHKFEDLPTELQSQFGEPAFVMRLELPPGRKLALVDADTVRKKLQTDGFFLQLPPELPVEQQITNRFN